MALLKSFYRRYISKLYNIIQIRPYTKYVTDLDIKKSYAILGIPEDSDQEKIRSTYLELVKKYHPDSGSEDASTEEFLKIDTAFKILLSKKAKDRWCTESVNFEVHSEEFDIKHTAPQHRQYLSYEGIGIGTPSQREKQYSKVRAMHAAENVMNHRINKAHAEENALLEKKQHTHKIKTKYGFDRLVEDLIQEAISKGEFSNLAGAGKPLKQHTVNPYVDFVTHKLNEVLIENGFTPEWIMLQKEIREEKSNLMRKLYNERKQLRPYPFQLALDSSKWDEIMERYTKLAVELNKKINKYNLLVPAMQKQMLNVNINKIAEKILKYGQTKDEEGCKIADSDFVIDEQQQQLQQQQRDKKEESTFKFLLNHFV